MLNALTRRLTFLGSFTLATGILTLSLGASPSFAGGSSEFIAEGKKLAFSRKKGNCLACHVMDDGSLAGNGGPPLVSMKARFPDEKVLRAQIWDSTVRNQHSIMPPFGRHGILNDEEIDKITAYVHTL